MNVDEFQVLRALYAAEWAGAQYHDGRAPSASEVQEFHNLFSVRTVGYHLRSLSARGLTERAGRRHGGALKWRLTPEARAVLDA